MKLRLANLFAIVVPGWALIVWGCFSIAKALPPPRAAVTFAWDYPTTNQQWAPDFALLWGTNRFEAGPEQAATVSIGPGLHIFTAVAVRNGLQSDTSNELAVRVMGFTLERSSDLSEWDPLREFTFSTTNETAQAFYRVRVWQ